MLCPSSPLASVLASALVSSVHTSPNHRIRYRSFIFDTHVHLWYSYMHIKYLVILTCWLIWFINQRALYNHALSVVCHCHWHRPASVLASLLSVHTSPWHIVRHRNFILGTHMHICPPYMHIKYLMILTCSF